MSAKKRKQQKLNEGFKSAVKLNMFKCKYLCQELHVGALHKILETCRAILKMLRINQSHNNCAKLKKTKGKMGDVTHNNKPTGLDEMLNFLEKKKLQKYRIRLDYDIT